MYFWSLSAMTNASTDWTHHMERPIERPATVAGFRPINTSQVEVSKSFDECSDLTHGEYKNTFVVIYSNVNYLKA